ncbi:MAG: hypothetical protein IJ660_04500 [Alphaproteobacteria bacterium]|nr:hypothetical protein [Alphaproteobacteria bacterium]
MNKQFLLLFIAMLLIPSFSAKADIDAIQKIQNLLQTVQEKATTYQEKIQEYKDQFKDASEKAKEIKDKAESGLSTIQTLDVDKIKELGATQIEGIPSLTDAPNEEIAKAAQEKLLPKSGEGNDSEAFKQHQEIIQAAMRDSIARLYAFAFTSRTQLLKETIRDDDMTDTNQMAAEVNAKAIDIVNRLAKIYMLESLMQEYQYTQSLKTLTVDMTAKQEESEEAHND